MASVLHILASKLANSVSHFTFSLITLSLCSHFLLLAIFANCTLISAPAAQPMHSYGAIVSYTYGNNLGGASTETLPALRQARVSPEPTVTDLVEELAPGHAERLIAGGLTDVEALDAADVATIQATGA